jgi:hypothetical protein
MLRRPQEPQREFRQALPPLALVQEPQLLVSESGSHQRALVWLPVSSPEPQSELHRR